MNVGTMRVVICFGCPQKAVYRRLGSQPVLLWGDGGTLRGWGLVERSEVIRDVAFERDIGTRK
jgi:hypothetical protein